MMMQFFLPEMNSQTWLLKPIALAINRGASLLAICLLSFKYIPDLYISTLLTTAQVITNTSHLPKRT